MVFFHVGKQWTNNWALKPKLDSNTCECCIFIVYVLLTFTTLWRHSVPLRDLGISSWRKGFLFSSENDSCCVHARSTFSNYTTSFSMNFTFFIYNLPCQTTTVLFLCCQSNIRGYRLMLKDKWPYSVMMSKLYSCFWLDLWQSATQYGETLPHPKSDEVIIKRNKHTYIPTCENKSRQHRIGAVFL